MFLLSYENLPNVYHVERTDTTQRISQVINHMDIRHQLPGKSARWCRFIPQDTHWTYHGVVDDHYYDDLTIFRPDVKYRQDSDVQWGDDCDGYYYVEIKYLNPPPINF